MSSIREYAENRTQVFYSDSSYVIVQSYKCSTIELHTRSLQGKFWLTPINSFSDVFRFQASQVIPHLTNSRKSCLQFLIRHVFGVCFIDTEHLLPFLWVMTQRHCFHNPPDLVADFAYDSPLILMLIMSSSHW